MDALQLLPEHLGPLHPAEQGLVMVLAFGPFVLLGVTVWLSRRRAAAEPTDPMDGPMEGPVRDRVEDEVDQDAR